MALLIRSILAHDYICSTKHKSGEFSASYWRVKAPPNFHCLGDIGVPHQHEPAKGTLVVQVVRCTELDALMPPIGYKRIHDDKKDNNTSCCFWMPIPPPGYKACGTVVTCECIEPSKHTIMCVKEKYVSVKAKIGSSINTTHRINYCMADDSYGAWTIEPEESCTCIATGSFYVGTEPITPNLQDFSDTTGHVLKVNSLKISPLSLDELHIAISKYGPILHFNPHEEYLPICVEDFAENSLLLNKETNEKSDVSLKNLPPGEDLGSKYQLILKDEKSRQGHIKRAISYVHAKANKFHTDLHFFVLFAYNGPAKAYFKHIVMGIKIHSKNVLLDPLGAHEGSWRHITVRVNSVTHKAEQVFYSQNSGGTWLDYNTLPKKNHTQPIVYSSRNGHACYKDEGHHKLMQYTIETDCMNLEFELFNVAVKGGKMLNCAKKYKIINAEYLGADAPPVPRWLSFYGKWGASKEGKTNDFFVKQVLLEAFAIKDSVFENLQQFNELVKLLVSLFDSQDQSDPKAPVSKNYWTSRDD